MVAAFCVSGYSSTYTRAGQKPFNPLLGETYECIREDKGWKFIAEQVTVSLTIRQQSTSWVVWSDGSLHGGWSGLPRGWSGLMAVYLVCGLVYLVGGLVSWQA